MQYRKKRKSNARSQETEQASLYAAIDLGTNNCRMLIAKKSKNGFRVVDSFSRITRLGEDVARSSTLSDKAMQRTLKALAICAQKLEHHAVDFVRCVATEACRRAQNGPQFIEDVQNVTGLYLETISPVEEANLALTGCSSLLNSERPNALVFDIGGGSTEIMWIEIKSDGTPEVIDMISLPLGVVTLSETYAENNLIPEHIYNNVKNMVKDAIDEFSDRNDIPSHIDQRRVQMLGTSGTVTTLGAISLNLPRYLRSRVDGLVLSFHEIQNISSSLLHMSEEERSSHPCIGINRADLVIAGCAILEALCELWPVGQITIADRGIREGILLNLMRKNP